MDEHQVALVAEQGYEPAAAVGGMLHGLEDRRRFVDGSLARRWGRRVPLRPADAEHLMQDAPALEGEGDGGELFGASRDSFAPGITFGHDAIN